MKELLILALMLIAATASGYLIEGYVFWGIMGGSIVDNGPVYLYSDTTDSPINYCCISPNGYYRFEDVVSGTYWVKAFGFEIDGPTTPWHQSLYVMVKVRDADVYQDIRPVNTDALEPPDCT